MKKFIQRIIWIIPISYMILIFILSSLPHNAVIELPNSKWDVFIKEGLHLVEFGILYVVFAIALVINRKLTARSSFIIACISALYGLSDEIHQYFIPYRSATIIDLIKDWIGVLAAWAHVKYHYFYRKRSILNKLEKVFS